MTYDNLEALGQVVRDLRTAKKLTQDELGKKAGYGSGAGVSISRLENGQLRPGAERLQGVAEALGLTREKLEARAAPRNVENLAATVEQPHGAVRVKDRIKRIQQEIEARTKVLTDVSLAFDAARDRARDEFFMRFVEIAGAIEGAPQPDPDRIRDDEATDADADEVVARQLKATSDGFARLLAGGAGTARALLGVGTMAAAAGAGRTTVLAGIVGAPAVLLVAGGLVWMVKRNSKQQQELDAKLDLAEVELKATKPGFKALTVLLPRATETLDYIAVHAGHAFSRWESELEIELESGSVTWERLSQSEQQRYLDFIEIAAAQMTVLTIDVQGLVTTHDSDDLNQLITRADKALSQSQDAVKARV